MESGQHGGPGGARLQKWVRLAGLGAKVDPVVNNIHIILVAPGFIFNVQVVAYYLYFLVCMGYIIVWTVPSPSTM